ncbi:putative serine/threonine-protein kinase [Hypsibius exemplaris]|uniref:Serine/threonine-protein kinase n=1 Tax=Hypsibius exemplaris TaxID=2072580 RepID=A0A1W0WFS0_HYPEX|nr:putative serine/threonine-protein kinase [Hypsibius exemplaris]
MSHLEKCYAHAGLCDDELAEEARTTQDPINNLGSQKIPPEFRNDENLYLVDFAKHPTMHFPASATDRLVDPYTDTVIAGAASPEIREFIMFWLEQYQHYRAPFTNIITDPSVLVDIDESNNNAMMALKRHSGYNGETFVNGHPLSFVLSAIDMGHTTITDTGTVYEDILRVPILTSALVLCYNLPLSVSAGQTLQLSLQQIADIFMGKIQNWNDPSLKTNNPWLAHLSTTDNTAISIATKKGITGETHWLVMAMLMESFRVGTDKTGWTLIPNYETNSPMRLGLKAAMPPAAQGMYKEYDSTVAVLGGTLSTPYRLCVAYLRDAQENNAKFAHLETFYGNGNYAPPSLTAMENFWTYFYDYNKGDHTNPTYPLLAFYHFYIKATNVSTVPPINTVLPKCSVAVNVLRFLRFVFYDKAFQCTAKARNWPYVFPGGLLHAYFVMSFRDTPQVCVMDGSNVTFATWNKVKEEILRENRLIEAAKGLTTTQLVSIVLVSVTLLLSLIVWRLNLEFVMMQRIRNLDYKIDSSEIFLILHQNETIDRYKGVTASRRMVDYHIPKSQVHTLYFGRWGAYQVMLRPCSLNIHRMDRKMKKAIIEMIDFSQHNHVATLYGISEVRNGRYFVSDFCPYGDLRSAIISKDYLFTLKIKFSLAGDVADGMCFLHQHGFLHGNLRSCAIYIEADLSAKVADWEYAYLHRLQGSYFAQETRLARTLTLFEQTAFYPWLYWSAPEILQSGMLGRSAVPTKAQDVYSFGIIMGEIFSDDAAFQRFQDAPFNFTPTEIITKILSGNLRPRLVSGNDAPVAVHRLLEHCWASEPTERPSFKTIKNVLLQVSSFRKPTSDLLVINSQLLADKLKRRGRRTEERYDAVSNEFHRYSHEVAPPPIWRQLYLTHVRPPLTRHDDAVILRCSLVSYSGLLTAHDPQVKRLRSAA